MIHRAFRGALCALALSACASANDDGANAGGSAGSGGSSGTAGESGASGTAGASAAGGTAGTSGTAGTAGVGGTAGTSGSAGAGGSGGSGGTGGAGGTAGSGGTAGTAGTGGSGGSAGSAGTSGAAGSGGTTPLGYACDSAIDLNDPSTHGLYVVSGVVIYDGTNAGSTLSGLNSPSCFSNLSSSKAVVHTYTNTGARPVELYVATVEPPVTSTLSDTVVWARTACDSSGTELGCADYDASFNSYGAFDLPVVQPGQKIFVIVSGYGASQVGRYRLELTPTEFLGEGEDCSFAATNLSCAAGLVCASDVPGSEVCTVPSELPSGSPCNSNNAAHTCVFPTVCTGAAGSQTCQGTLLMSENFSSALGVFGVNDHLADGKSWIACDPNGSCGSSFASNYTESPSGGNFAIISDEYNLQLFDEVLRAGPFDATALTQVKLRFYQYYSHYTTDVAYVDVSTDGSTWNHVATYSSSVTGQTDLDLSAQVAGSPTFWIGFRYDDDVNAGDVYANSWQIDDVTLYGN